MLLRQLFDPQTSTYTYLLADPQTREAVIVDPVVGQVDRDLALIYELDLKLLYTLDTHVHADHVTGSGELRRITGALSGVSDAAGVPCVDMHLTHGDLIRFGRYALEVRSTPGHTNGCLTFVAKDGDRTYAFTGDALLIRGCGRTDFQQGDSEALYRSVHEQIFTLPPETIVYPGHDYRGHRSSTVEEERRHNPRLNASISALEFVIVMGGLNFPHPARIHEALPANMACGRPTDEEEGHELAPFRQLDVRSLDASSEGRIVDVRSFEEFHGTRGHLPGAVLAPLPELAEHAATWSRHEPVLLVCETGRRSTRACSVLTNLGFSNVRNLTGGMAAWRAQHGGTSCSTASSPRS